MKNIALILIFFSMFFSCTKKFKYDLTSEKKINVSCFLIANEPIRLNLSYTFTTSNSDCESIFLRDGAVHFCNENYIKDADVFIYEDNIFKEKLSYQPSAQSQGWYLSNSLIPQVGKKYELKIFVSGYDTVFAETSIPIPSHIDTIKKISDNFDIQIELAKQNNEKSYYSIDCYSNAYQYQEYIPTLEYISRDIIFETRDELGQYSYNSYYYYYSYFSDSLFVNNKYYLQMQVLSSGSNKLYVKLNSLSSDTYLFYKTVYFQNQYMTNPLTQPVKIYSNIINGSGIFAGSSYTIDSLKISKF